MSKWKNSVKVSLSNSPDLNRTGLWTEPDQASRAGERWQRLLKPANVPECRAALGQRARALQSGGKPSTNHVRKGVAPSSLFECVSVHTIITVAAQVNCYLIATKPGRPPLSAVDVKCNFVVTLDSFVRCAFGYRRRSVRSRTALSMKSFSIENWTESSRFAT